MSILRLLEQIAHILPERTRRRVVPALHHQIELQHVVVPPHPAGAAEDDHVAVFYRFQVFTPEYSII